MAERDGVVFYRSFWEAITHLGDDDQLASVKAIVEYGLYGKEPECSGVATAIFMMAKPQIDANNRRYENGTKGGRPKTDDKEIPRENQKKPSANQAKTYQEPKEKEKVKDKVKEKDNKTYCVHFEQMWQAYPRKKEKAAAYKAYKARLADGFSEDELETAVKRYADACRILGTEEQYIKHAATFLGPNTPFADYLVDNYKPPVKKVEKPNRFHNFDATGEDYDAVVKELYG